MSQKNIQTYIERQWRGRPDLAANWSDQHEQRLRSHLEQAERILAQSIAENAPPTADELRFLEQLGWTVDDIQEETHRISAKMEA